MKKIIALLAVLGAGIVAASLVAKRRGQDIGEFAGEWADRAKDVAATASDSATNAAASTADVLKDQAGTLKDAAVDLRDELPLGDRS